MVNLYRVKSMLKFKINVNLPRLLCIVVSAALNSEFERFGGLCVDCYYMTCYYVILSTSSVRIIFVSRLSVGKIQEAVYPFDLIRSKNSRSRLSVPSHPFEKFKKPFIRSTSSVRKIQEAVYPFDLIRSKILISRSSIYGTHFERLA